ncbi:hypothetical protein DDZ13_07375 [Coraliomargarita sinensis]|uniref:Uncharacterized protein n=1 Tax=Coraliomargarita sinensis TaxID=2174842 RepID=A0A317ZFK0_9BACT|nr:hypothetical protein [Coraliomargarita sinensis]PXA04345.1 hypothetical protein DDZ13_07375 [Coraliomargarita sinensis]
MENESEHSHQIILRGGMYSLCFDAAAWKRFQENDGDYARLTSNQHDSMQAQTLIWAAMNDEARAAFDRPQKLSFHLGYTDLQAIRKTVGDLVRTGALLAFVSDSVSGSNEAEPAVEKSGSPKDKPIQPSRPLPKPTRFKRQAEPGIISKWGL